MKRRRQSVSTCVDCNKSFESQETSTQHFNSRNHVQRLLAIKNAQLMDTEEERDILEDVGIRVEDVYGHNGISSDEESFPDDDMGEVFFNAEAEQLIDENADKDFFPFPSEKFFLLYCYAHSIMRPKVRTAFFCNTNGPY